MMTVYLINGPMLPFTDAVKVSKEAGDGMIYLLDEEGKTHGVIAAGQLVAIVIHRVRMSVAPKPKRKAA